MTSSSTVSARPRRLCVGAVLAVSLSLAGCARAPMPASPAERARIRATCPPGSFVAAMAANCPAIVAP